MRGELCTFSVDELEVNPNASQVCKNGADLRSALTQPGKFNVAMEHHHAINGKIHYEWPFSIAMLNYQRVIQMN